MGRFRTSDQTVDGEHGAVIGLRDTIAEAIDCGEDGGDGIFIGQVLLEARDGKLLA
jgi:hypothetical protein